MIRDMISSKSLTTSQMAEAAGCSKRLIITISANLRMFGNVRAPLIRGGRPRIISPIMLESLCDHLLEKLDLCLDEMAKFLYNEFTVLASTYTISRALRSQGWTKKVARQVVQERNADLRDYYLHQLSEFRSFHLVFIDESGCDKRAGFRRTGWSPHSVAPVQVSHFQRGQQYQILAAYCQDGILMSQVFQGSTDANLFEDFVEQLLHHCGRWTEPSIPPISYSSVLAAGPILKKRVQGGEASIAAPCMQKESCSRYSKKKSCAREVNHITQCFLKIVT
jgi:transposase